MVWYWQFMQNSVYFTQLHSRCVAIPCTMFENHFWAYPTVRHIFLEAPARGDIAAFCNVSARTSLRALYSDPYKRSIATRVESLSSGPWIALHLRATTWHTIITYERDEDLSITTQLFSSTNPECLKDKHIWKRDRMIAKMWNVCYSISLWKPLHEGRA